MAAGMEGLAAIDRRVFVGGLVVTSIGVLAGCRTGDDTRVSADLGSSGAGRTPSADDLMKVGPLGDKMVGRADAPVSIIEYVSLTCPYSRRFHVATYPQVKKEFIDRGVARLILREFPIGRSAAAAAVVTRAAPEKDYFALYDKFLDQQKEWTSQEVRAEAIYDVAAQVGMTREMFDRGMADQRIIDGLVWVKQRGRELGVSGTPTFFINATKVRGALTYVELKGLIESDRSA